MNRRSQPGGLTFGLRGTNTVYGSGGGSNLGRPIALGVILLTIAVLAFFLLGRVFGGESCGSDPYCATSRDIAVPDGYELVTHVYEINADSPDIKNPPPGSTTVQIQFPMEKTGADTRNLSFYRYVEETKAWEPLAAAQLDPQGTVVSGVFRETPAVVAVLRRLSAAGHVVAYLERNDVLRPDAVNQITVLHTNDFRPGTDGTIEGELSTVLPAGNYAFYPMISASGANKGDLAIVRTLLADPALRSRHVAEIVKLVNTLGLQGIDIAYMDLTADQRTVFTLFIAELGQALHGQGKKLSVSLPAPIKTGDRIDEGAYDWAEIAKDADILQMAPYRDQGTYRLVMPEIIQALTSRVDPAKLVLTVTPYATEKSSDGLRRLSLTEAMATAGKLKFDAADGQPLVTSNVVNVVGTNIDSNENLRGLQWAPEVATVYFTYKLNGNRTIWIENFFSIGFKLEYISQYKLGGVAIEDASDDIYLGNIWPALIPFISSGQPVLLQPNPNDLAPRWRVTKGTAEGGRNGVLEWTTPAEPGEQSVYLTLSDGVALFESVIVANIQQRDARTPVTGGR